MVTIDQIKELAATNDMRISFQWDKEHCGPTPPKLVGIQLFFFKLVPDVWAQLLTTVSEVPITISGTRMMTGSGATDGRLYPEYARLLSEINVKRAELGLGAIRN